MELSEVYKKISSLLYAMQNCKKSIQLFHDNNEDKSREHFENWFIQHGKEIEKTVSENMPDGSGFDVGTKLDFLRSTPEKLVFYTEFHHMNETGMYDGWTQHTITVTPSLAFEYTLKISGPNKNDIKEYISQCF